MIGYYGKENLGDEAILSSVLRLMEENGIDRSRVVVASFASDDTSARHGVRSISVLSVIGVFRTLLCSSHLLFSGGGYHFSGVPLLYYLGLVLCAKILGVSVCFLAIGVEPVQGRLNQMLTRWLLAHADWLSVRDDLAANEIKRITGRTSVRVTADPALTIQCENISSCPKDRPVIAVSFLTARNAPKYSHIRPLFPVIVDWIIERFDADVVLVATSRGEGDLDVIREVVRKCDNASRISQAPWPHNLEELCSVLGAADFVVAMRLHCLILSSLVGTPFAAISRSPKVEAFARRMRQPIVGDIETDLPDLLRNIEEAYHQRGTAAEQLTEKVRLLGSQVREEFGGFAVLLQQQ
jgi:polysaccharide pyruvyl transferase CsaB